MKPHRESNYREERREHNIRYLNSIQSDVTITDDENSIDKREQSLHLKKKLKFLEFMDLKEIQDRSVRKIQKFSEKRKVNIITSSEDELNDSPVNKKAKIYISTNSKVNSVNSNFNSKSKDNNQINFSEQMMKGKTISDMIGKLTLINLYKSKIRNGEEKTYLMILQVQIGEERY